MNVSERAPPPDARPAAAPSAACVLVLNRKARNGHTDIDGVLEALTADGTPPAIVELDESTDLGEAIRAAIAQGARRIVVAGGDGTVNSAIPSALEAGVPLGVIPLGTANDLARTLELPADPVDAARVIARGRTRRIDVGRVNDAYFLNAAGIGFSAELQQELGAGLKGWLGPFAYPVGVLKRWRRHRPFTVALRGDGVAQTKRAVQVTVANGRSYGGGMTAHEDAQIDDAHLDVVVVLPRPLWRYALSIVGFKRGVYRNAPVITTRVTALELRTRRPRPVATDGETRTRTPASFSIMPQALEVFVPDDAA